MLSTSAVESRFEALRASNLTPFVGRRRELTTLIGLWRLAGKGSGQVAVICGQPGIGKLRLTIELEQRSSAISEFATFARRIEEQVPFIQLLIRSNEGLDTTGPIRPSCVTPKSKRCWNRLRETDGWIRR